MGFWVIQPDGTLYWSLSAPSLYAISGFLQRSSAELMPLDWPTARGYVTSVRLLMPDQYPRNPVGAAVLATLGAKPAQIGGPVIIAGHENGYPAALRQWQRAAVESIGTAVHCALAEIPTPHGDVWGSEIRRYAEWNNLIDPPPWQWRSTEFKI